MNVNSQLKNASLEIVTNTTVAGKSPDAGRIYYNADTKKILIGDGSGFSEIEEITTALINSLVSLPQPEIIGSVKTSLLTEAQFNSEISDGTWFLADGRSCIGTQYETITGNSNIPDMRGKFLRAKDNGRHTTGDGNGDPYGDKTLGVNYEDATAPNGLAGTTSSAGAHSHTVNNLYIGSSDFSFTGPVVNSDRNTPAATTNTAGAHTHSLNITGDLETAPAHVIVNYYIKVDY